MYIEYNIIINRIQYNNIIFLYYMYIECNMYNKQNTIIIHTIICIINRIKYNNAYICIYNVVHIYVYKITMYI